MSKLLSPIRFLSAHFKLSDYFNILITLTALALSSNAQSLEVTEMFPGQAGDDLTADWFEITNTGSGTWMAGAGNQLFYDDESAEPLDAVMIQGIDQIGPGSSAIVLIGNASEINVFVDVWSPVINLNGIGIGFADGAGLGAGGDAVILWMGDPNATDPVAMAAYPDTQAFDGKSYDATLGEFSEIGNANGAVQTLALGGNSADVPNIASPGNLGPVMYNPGRPVVVIDPTFNTPLLNLTGSGSAYVSGVLQDPTDPAATIGICFTITDPDTNIEDLNVYATSDNQNVVPNDNLLLTQCTGSGTGQIFQPMTGSGTGYFNLAITGSGTGYANIEFVVEDPDQNLNSFAIRYASSREAIHPETTYFHTGAADGSTAISVGDEHMWVADDEDQVLRLYNRSRSGYSVNIVDLSADLGDTEIDLESSFRLGDTIFWMGSLAEPDMSVAFSVIETGTGSGTGLTYLNQYDNLRDDIIAWDNGDGHGNGPGYYEFQNSFEVEGMGRDPNTPGGALLALSSPLANGNALLVPINNFVEMVSSDVDPNSAVIGTPIEIDLNRHNIRSFGCNEYGCIILAGPFANIPNFQLYTWTGNPIDAPELRAVNLKSAPLGNYEGIAGLPGTPFMGKEGDDVSVQLIIDMGTFDLYGDGSEANDLPIDEWKKFASEIVTLGPVEIPPASFEGDIVINEIMQNPSAVGDVAGEWFELFNNTIADIDINGWMISDNDIDEHIINHGSPLIISSGGYLILGVNSDVSSNGGVAVDYTYNGSFALANGADELILKAYDGTLVDSVAWDGGIIWPDPEGASMSLNNPNSDNNDGTNWCIAMNTFGDGDFGSPGMYNDCGSPPVIELEITEIFAGQAGTDLTADWFEIVNTGSGTMTFGGDMHLFYDDDSMDPLEAVQIEGIDQIEPGQAAIVLVGTAADVPAFMDAWSPVIDLTGVPIGYSDGPGLGGGGDLVTLWLGDPNTFVPEDKASYPDTENDDGKSYDVSLMAFSEVGNANGAVQTIALGGDNMDVPNIGSPGNGRAIPQNQNIFITEIFSGQAGAVLTADWFEIVNTGSGTMTFGGDMHLFYDDDSMDPLDAVQIEGIDQIEPGQAAIVLVGTAADVPAFMDAWSPVIDLTGVSVGYSDGPGLGGGGDLVTLWLGDPNTFVPVDKASYPDTENDDGKSYDVSLMAFSEVGNANGAVQTIALGGDNMDVPNIGSPGNGRAIPQNQNIFITEIFSGQAGPDLTADWFEIVNTGSGTMTFGGDMHLFYDDDSMDPFEAVQIEGINQLAPGQTAIVLLGTTADVPAFMDVWSPVIDLTGVPIGYSDGPDLDGGGDLITLWLGDPNTFVPIDKASYPDTENDDGKSYDVSLMAFSEVGNANGAVQTIAQGGDNMDVANIGSPGNGRAIPQNQNIFITEIFSGQAGEDITADWFELVNRGDEAWINGVSPNLHYDDESEDPNEATLISGINQINPGEAAIVVIGLEEDAITFREVWGEVIILDGVEIGFANGAGLGAGGDVVALWAGDPNVFAFVDRAAFPSTVENDGQSYDVELGEFSVVDNANGAVQTLALGGDNADVPNIGSPGNLGPVSSVELPDFSNDISVFPNPSSGLFSIKVLEGHKLIRGTVLDLDGRKIMSSDYAHSYQKTLNLTSLRSGIYLLRLELENGVAVKKLIKE